jgi:hypothetical protein
MNDITTNLNDTDGGAPPDAMELPSFLDRTKSAWRKILPIHPDCELVPPMSDEELKDTGEDIRKHDLRFPIAVLAANGSTSLLDGRSRLDAMELAGILRIDRKVTLEYLTPAGEWTKVPVTHVPPSTDTRAYVLSANVHRRHLDQQKKRETIEAILKAAPEKSNLAIAKTAKVSDKTVGAVRAKLEATSEIPKLEKTTGADGKARPARKLKRAPEVDEATLAKRAAAAESIRALMAEQEAITEQVLAQPRVVETVISDVVKEAAEETTEAPVPEDNPITRAWEEATHALRREFALAYITDLTKIFDDEAEAEVEPEPARKTRKVKLIEHKAPLAEVVSEAFEMLAELGNEMREAFDNSPESLQQTAVNQAREAAADALEYLEAPDVPAELAELQVTWSEVHRPPSRGVSRATR